MATEYSSKNINELTNTNTAADANLLAVGDASTGQLKKITLSNFANWIKSKLQAFTFSFAGGVKTLEDELNSITQGAGTVNYVHHGATYITTASKDIFVILTTNRVIQQNVRITSVEPKACQIRQNGNYLYNKTSGTLSDLHVAYTKRYNGIQLTLTYFPNDATEKQAFPNATNNDAVGIYLSVDITYEVQ